MAASVFGEICNFFDKYSLWVATCEIARNISWKSFMNKF